MIYVDSTTALVTDPKTGKRTLVNRPARPVQPARFTALAFRVAVTIR